MSSAVGLGPADSAVGPLAMSHSPGFPDRPVREVQAAQGEKPGAIILDTEKGAGVQKIIDIELNHHITCSPELADAVISELEAQKKG